MREGNVFSLSTPVCVWGGYPGQVQTVGYPVGEYPTLGTLHQTWPTGGVPLLGGGAPHLGQQMEYLIRRGRYHAGGLSCTKYVAGNNFLKLTKVFLCYQTKKETLLHLMNFQLHIAVKIISSFKFQCKIYQMRVNVSIYPCLLGLLIVNWWG